MLHVEESAGTTAVHDFVERVGFQRVEAGVKGDVLHREVVLCHVVVAGLVVDVRRRRNMGWLLVVMCEEVHM